MQKRILKQIILVKVVQYCYYPFSFSISVLEKKWREKILENKSCLYYSFKMQTYFVYNFKLRCTYLTFFLFFSIINFLNYRRGGGRGVNLIIKRSYLPAPWFYWFMWLSYEFWAYPSHQTVFFFFAANLKKERTFFYCLIFLLECMKKVSLFKI